MLRHIFSFSLAMTACAALIPTKVNAATLSIYPPLHNPGEIARKPGDVIDFRFSAKGEQGSQYVIYKELQASFDSDELEELTPLQWLVSQNLQLQPTYREIASWKLKVKNPLKNGIPDVWATLIYDEETQFGLSTDVSIPASGPDVIPVPEPLTIFGTAIGLGCGVLFKRKSSKKTVF